MTIDRLLEDQIVALIQLQLPNALVLSDVGDGLAPLPKITVRATINQQYLLRTVGVEELQVEVTSHVEIPAENWRDYTQEYDDAIDCVLLSQNAAADATGERIEVVGQLPGDASQDREERKVARTRSAIYYARTR